MQDAQFRQSQIPAKLTTNYKSIITPKRSKWIETTNQQYSTELEQHRTVNSHFSKQRHNEATTEEEKGQEETQCYLSCVLKQDERKKPNIVSVYSATSRIWLTWNVENAIKRISVTLKVSIWKFLFTLLTLLFVQLKVPLIKWRKSALLIQVKNLKILSPMNTHTMNKSMVGTYKPNPKIC